jgi:hypothetical protein
MAANAPLNICWHLYAKNTLQQKGSIYTFAGFLYEKEHPPKGKTFQWTKLFKATRDDNKQAPLYTNYSIPICSALLGLLLNSWKCNFSASLLQFHFYVNY